MTGKTDVMAWDLQWKGNKQGHGIGNDLKDD
jgi:hypothetical protein